ncbi:MAG TPA: hypothetical protein VD793_03240 [Gemmatimonadales bacterium]|nr:hypothetical protein [Gemmatimonadales bacterium]
MNGQWAAYAAALALGAAHAIEVDHMVAVTAFVGGQPRVATAARFGLRWGLGHAGVVFLAGGALAWAGVRVPDHLAGWAELIVGLTLVALGAWAARRAARLHLHPPHSHGDHAHLHAHATGATPHPHEHAHHGHQPSARHGHLSTLVGAVHGLAGTAPVVALIPVTLMTTTGAALAYLAAFGVGTAAAMTAYAALAALAARRMARSPRGARILAFGTAGASTAVGLWWVSRAVS